MRMWQKMSVYFQSFSLLRPAFLRPPFTKLLIGMGSPGHDTGKVALLHGAALFLPDDAALIL